MSAARRAALALAAAGAVLPGGASGLEPRYDHRDQLGVVVEVGGTRDTVQAPDGGSTSSYRALLRLGGSVAISEDGNEIVATAVFRPGSGGTDSLRWSAQAVYRGYFGTEELKTFFDLGVAVPLSPRVAVGPRVGLGALYDLGRSAGLYAEFAFTTSFGQVRSASLELAAGVQVRWP